MGDVQQKNQVRKAPVRVRAIPTCCAAGSWNNLRRGGTILSVPQPASKYIKNDAFKNAITMRLQSGSLQKKEQNIKVFFF
jgi:hypothetical protein